MRKQIKIGENLFNSKKSAIDFYKDILNKYDFGEFLDDKDYDSILDLLEYDTELASSQDSDPEQDDSKEACNEIEDFFIENVRIAKVQYSTKCFELIYDNGESDIISYRMLINRPKITQESLFTIACRNTIQNDLIKLKQLFFEKNSKFGMVKCQESNDLAKWEELAVDHRQPNTFSVIVDRFKEVNNIDLESILFFTDENNLLKFKDNELSENFKNYHKEKANLRIVKKELNLSRTGMGKIKTTSKDLRIE